MINRNLRAALSSRLGQTLTPEVCAQIEAQALSAHEFAAGDLDVLPSWLKAKLQESLDVAAPMPIPWGFAAKEVADGRWQMIHEGDAVSVLHHGSVMGVPVTNIVAMAGELDDCLAVMTVVEEKAAEAGSSLVIYLGRRGWGKFLPSYREMAVMCVKELP